ncbi:hypothetical protein J2T12_004839 [Paenibacillus anaericanus]|nr:hypothetical protein [Paenibacillus anaericanus]
MKMIANRCNGTQRPYLRFIPLFWIVTEPGDVIHHQLCTGDKGYWFL